MLVSLSSTMAGKKGKEHVESFKREQTEEQRYQRGRARTSPKWFEDLGRVAAGQIHSPRSSEKVCKRLVRKGCFIPWGTDVDTPPHTSKHNIQAHSPVHFQRNAC